MVDERRIPRNGSIPIIPSGKAHPPLPSIHSLGVGGLLGENPEDKVALSVRLVGGRNDDVFPGGESQARADLPQVDEELRASAGGVGEEELPLQVDPGPACQL